MLQLSGSKPAPTLTPDFDVAEDRLDHIGNFAPQHDRNKIARKSVPE
jgi:hypothetical protein|tara:strand:- start:1563 stop:1703 length:141 start_codon:yes stop_codon:yes gene_type:complete